MVFHEGHSTAAVQRLSGIAVCHLISVYPTQYIKINSAWQYKESEVNAFATSTIFDNFIPTYHSLHVCSRQALLCARLAAFMYP